MLPGPKGTNFYHQLNLAACLFFLIGHCLFLQHANTSSPYIDRYSLSHQPHARSLASSCLSDHRDSETMTVIRIVSVCLAGLLSLLCPVLADPSSSKSLNGLSSEGFSLAVSQNPNRERDFVRDWAAAHQKWGNGVPEEVSSTFQLLDSGECLSLAKRKKEKKRRF